MLGLITTSGALGSCASPHQIGDEVVVHATAFPSPELQMPVEGLPGLNNVVAYAPDVLSGSSPLGQAGFESLTEIGIRTIISVDGAVPDVEAARQLGLRYVHLPVGYDGMSQSRMLEIARAIHELPGPFYVHCHHGKHRSAGAAGAALVALGELTPDEAIERMHVSGTSPAYQGLFECVASTVPATPPELAGADATFPEISRPSNDVEAMLQIDQAMDELKAVEAAGWTIPRDHPDLVPAAEAGRLADLLRLLQQDRGVMPRSEGYLERLVESTALAGSLEEALISGAAPPDLSAQLQRLHASCRSCHAEFRD